MEYYNIIQPTVPVMSYVSVAAVYCEGFSGGEHGEDSEAEAGPVGEGFRLHEHQPENISD